MKWFQKSAQDSLKEQEVDLKTGLSASQVSERLEKYGLNQLKSAQKLNPFKLFFGQFKDALIIILLIAASVSLGLSFIDTDSEHTKDVDSSQSRSVILYQELRCDRATEEYLETDQFCSNPEQVCDSKFADQHTSSCQMVSSTSSSDEHKGNEGAKEALLIFAIVFAIAIVGFLNEYKAEKTVEALKQLVGFKAKVRRDGEVTEVDTSNLVPGDIVIIEAGQKVPADIRLIDVSQLHCNEASLTGESLPVSKNIDAIEGDASLGDQKCMLFAGTFITEGSAVGLVVGTGQLTEIGKIANLVESVESESTPMQQKLDDLGKKLGIVIAAVCALVFIIVFFFVSNDSDSLLRQLIFAFTAAVALAVAAIPEGLAFVVRISLALGARRMAGKNALVRKLSAVEALGSTDTICSDKTGTLTRGEMTVRSLFVNNQVISVGGTGYEMKGEFNFKSRPTHLDHLLTVGVLCNNANIREGTVLGDPTEGSLIVSAGKAELSQAELNKKYPRLREIAFSSERKRMTTVHSTEDGQFLIATKGAVEMILERCTSYYTEDGQAKPLGDEFKKKIIAQNQKLSGQALRVLAFASKQVPNKPNSDEQTESGLVFIGLQAMMDPPREEVIEVIHRVQAEAGMRVIMITGDYIETAKAVAKEIGIDGEAISGIELDKISQEEFEDQVENISVYARVNPEHKIRIVQALKKHGHQVAMTGDGVNDAPAIKAADIGIAMGITGTDVSKEAADLILLDDKFLTIINAIEEGRGIFDNVRKFVNFLISCNIAEVIAVVLGIIFFNDLILTAAQLLFINIVTDGLPAVALGSDPAQTNILQSKPKRFQEAIVSKRIWAEITIFGLLMSVILIAQYWFNTTNESRIAAVSAAFTAMVVYEIVRLIDIRTDYKIKWFSNPWLSIAIGSSLILQLAVLYLPAMAGYFDVGPLSSHDWLIMIAGSALLFVIMKLLNPVLDKMIAPEHSLTATNPH
jgi:P-type Ca2+ transporter type 2C